MIATLIVLGLLVWIPTLIVVSLQGVTLFVGIEIVGALAPLATVGLAAFAAGALKNNPYLMAFTFALAPLLMLAGSATAWFIKRAVWGNVHSDRFNDLSQYWTWAAWAILALLMYASASRIPEPKKTDLSAGNPPT